MNNAWAAIKLGVIFVLSLGLLACTSAPTSPPAPALQAAQRLEQRAAQALAHGDPTTAVADYQAASSVYASLALTEQHVLAQLSMARALAEQGQMGAAWQTVAQVLARIAAHPDGISPSTQALAYGRAAALRLSRDPIAAQQHLAQALNLCQPPCLQRAALQVLQSRGLLQQGQPDAALATSTAALQTATDMKNPLEQANARRVRAQAALALQQPGAAADDALIALGLDQTLGLATRVQADLRLLVAAHGALGEGIQVQRYQSLLDQATRAALTPALSQGEKEGAKP